MTDAPTSTTTDSSTPWPSEPASGRGRSHGTSSTRPFDRWFRYPAGFASDYVDLLLGSLDLDGGTIIDCFAGSGVTGTAATARGLDFFGIEAHPEIAELAALKLAPVSSSSSIKAAAARALKAAKSLALSVPVEGETDLVKRSFAIATLGDLSRLRRVVQETIASADPAGPYLKWALLGTLRDVADVKVGWPYQRPGISRKPRHLDAYARFQARVDMMIADLEGVEVQGRSSMTTAAGQLDLDLSDIYPRESRQTGHAVVVHGDSRHASSWASLATPASACIASPPYLNNFDYADATRLELYFWGTASTWGDMCTGVRDKMVTATTQQSSTGEMRAALEGLATNFPESAIDIEALVDQIVQVKQERQRRSKEYDQVLPAYFLSMGQILTNLHRSLDSGATVLWLVGDSAPYGVYLDTPGLIGQLAAEVGFEVKDDVSLRVRGNRWSSNPDRHQVPLAERLLVLGRT